MYRAIVTDNPICYKRHQQRVYEEHRERLRNMRSTVHTNARVSLDCSPPKHRGTRVNLKKIRLQEERYAQIERENTILLEKMSKIMTSQSSPVHDDAHVEFAPGIRLNKHQIPIIDNYVSERSSYPGHAIPSRSLNTEARKRELTKIMMENQALLRRLQNKEPFYSSAQWEEERRLNEHYLRNIRLYPYGDEPRLDASGSSGGFERYGSQDQFSPHDPNPEAGPEAFARTWNGAATGQTLPGAPPSAPATLIASQPAPAKKKTLKPLKKEAPPPAAPKKEEAKRPGSAGAAPHSLPPIEKQGQVKKEVPIRQTFVSPAPDLEPKFQKAETDFAKKQEELKTAPPKAAEDEEAAAEAELQAKEREAVMQQLLSDDEDEGGDGKGKGAKRDFGYAKYDFKEGSSPSPAPPEEAPAKPQEEAAAAVMGDVLGAVRENLAAEAAAPAEPPSAPAEAEAEADAPRRAMFAEEPAESEPGDDVMGFDEGQRAKLQSAKSVRAGPPAKPRDEQDEAEAAKFDAEFEGSDEPPPAQAASAEEGPSDLAEKEPAGTARTAPASAPTGDIKPKEKEKAKEEPQEDGDGGYIVEDDGEEGKEEDEKKEEEEGEGEGEKPAVAEEEEAKPPKEEEEKEPEPAKKQEEKVDPEAAAVVGAVFEGVKSNLAEVEEDRPGTTAGAREGPSDLAEKEPAGTARTALASAPAGDQKAAPEPARPAAVAEEEEKAEEPKAEEEKAEEPKAEEPKAEEPKAEEPKAEELKAEEPKAEEPKAGENAVDVDALALESDEAPAAERAAQEEGPSDLQEQEPAMTARSEPKPDGEKGEEKPKAEEKKKEEKKEEKPRPVPALPVAAAAAADRESEAFEAGLAVAVAGLAEELAAAAALASKTETPKKEEPKKEEAKKAEPAPESKEEAAPASPKKAEEPKKEAAAPASPKKPESPKKEKPASPERPASAKAEPADPEAALAEAVAAAVAALADDVATVVVG